MQCETLRYFWVWSQLISGNKISLESTIFFGLLVINQRLLVRQLQWFLKVILKLFSVVQNVCPFNVFESIGSSENLLNRLIINCKLKEPFIHSTSYIFTHLGTDFPFRSFWDGRVRDLCFPKKNGPNRGEHLIWGKAAKEGASPVSDQLLLLHTAQLHFMLLGQLI